MPRRGSKPKPMRLQQLVDSSPTYPLHVRVIKGIVGTTDAESIAAGDILVIALDKKDTYMSCRDADDKRFTISMDCPFAFLETGLSAAQSKDEWLHFLDSSLLQRPGRSVAQLKQYPLPMVVALKDEVTRKKGIAPRDCMIFDKIVTQHVVVCHRNATSTAADGATPPAITLPIDCSLKVTLASTKEASHDYETLWSSVDDDIYSLVNRLAIGVDPPAQQTFNAKVSQRGRYKTPTESAKPRRSTMAVAGNLAPSPYRRRSSEPAGNGMPFTPTMFGRPSSALTGQQRPSLNGQHAPSHAARPRLPSNHRARAATTAQPTKSRKAYQVVRVSPRGSEPSSQAASRDASRPPSREGLPTGNHGQTLAPITLDQVRARTATVAIPSQPPSSRPTAVPACMQERYTFEDPPTPPERPSLACKQADAATAEPIVVGVPEAEAEVEEYGFLPDYNNLDPADDSNRLNGPGDTSGAYAHHQPSATENFYGVAEGGLGAESLYGTAFDVLSDQDMFGQGVS
eukprot:m.100739 g.100739  ORF g.100739 m.100739 type:complete len:514 (-) comp15139_c0_seq1:31-1572(-)